MSGESKSKNISSDLTESLASTALSDVQKAMENVGLDDPYHKRTALRAIISAIEVLLWIYRDSVKSIALDLEILDSPHEMAFEEKTYRIDKQGKLKEQAKYSLILSMIRFTVAQAQNIKPSIEVDFGGQDWAYLKAAIDTRNQITHPKQASDLDIAEDDIHDAFSALLWFGNIVTETTETLNLTVKKDMDKMRAFLNFMKSRDQKSSSK